MKKVKITAVRRTEYEDLSGKYEIPRSDRCDIAVGQVFVSENAEKPEGLCDSAWQTVFPFVLTLACGGGGIYGDWMKDPHTAMVSCNDGFRPVSFLLETEEERI